MDLKHMADNIEVSTKNDRKERIGEETRRDLKQTTKQTST